METPLASMSTCAWYSSWLISSAARAGVSCSAAIQDSAASSTSFFPIECTPASSACTVPESSGRVRALSLSSLQSSSKVFIVTSSLGGADPAQRCRRDERRRSGLVALVLAGPGKARPIERLLLGVTGEQPETDGHAVVERDTAEPVGGGCADVLEVRCAA